MPDDRGSGRRAGQHVLHRRRLRGRGDRASWPGGACRTGSRCRTSGSAASTWRYQLLEPYDLVVLVDAVQRGGPPGTRLRDRGRAGRRARAGGAAWTPTTSGRTLCSRLCRGLVGPWERWWWSAASRPTRRRDRAHPGRAGRGRDRRSAGDRPGGQPVREGTRKSWLCAWASRAGSSARRPDDLDLGQVEVAGVVREINLALLDGPFVPGEYILIHSGFALERMSARAGRRRARVLRRPT